MNQHKKKKILVGLFTAKLIFNKQIYKKKNGNAKIFETLSTLKKKLFFRWFGPLRTFFFTIIFCKTIFSVMKKMSTICIHIGVSS